MHPNSIEVTTVIGCPGTCSRYCAQEVFLRRYGDRTKELTIEDWHKIIHNLPTDIAVHFGGFSEPLRNPNIIDLAKLAVTHGHKIGFFTTLIGASDTQIDALAKLSFDMFTGPCTRRRQPENLRSRLPPETL